MRVNDLLPLTRRELSDLLRAGHPIDARALDDTEYRGVSLGLPAFVERLTWKTFKKVFHRDPSTGVLRGWNVRIEQRGIDGPYVPKQRRGAPFTFGHFHVVEAAGRAPAGFDRGLLIDYGAAPHGRFDAAALLRDPIVALEPGSADKLLGWSYLAIGRRCLGTPSFFLLERDVPITHRADPRR
jgi:hypothetical protein